MSFRWPPHVTALCAYAIIAIAFNWPLPLHLGTHLTGPPESDAGVYVWNQWVFHHEVVHNRAHPYFTSMIFAASGPADLSLHNYTSFANLLALPLVSSLGVIETFNLVYLAMQVITAYAMFLLARHFT
jgi:hypothetical protein